MSDEFIISQTRKFLKRENCTGLWPQCRAFSCTSNGHDHNQARHQNATRTTLSNPRRVLSHANSSIRSYTNTHSSSCERSLPSAHNAITSGHRMMSSRSWLWQRQYSSESNNTPKKKGLLESQIGQELMTEAAEQNSIPGSFEGKFSFRQLIFCLLKPQCWQQLDVNVIFGVLLLFASESGTPRFIVSVCLQVWMGFSHLMRKQH